MSLVLAISRRLMRLHWCESKRFVKPCGDQRGRQTVDRRGLEYSAAWLEAQTSSAYVTRSSLDRC
jgi:hypothetical protein